MQATYTKSSCAEWKFLIVYQPSRHEVNDKEAGTRDTFSSCDDQPSPFVNEMSGNSSQHRIRMAVSADVPCLHDAPAHPVSETCCHIDHKQMQNQSVCASGTGCSCVACSFALNKWAWGIGVGGIGSESCHRDTMPSLLPSAHPSHPTRSGNITLHLLRKF